MLVRKVSEPLRTTPLEKIEAYTIPEDFQAAKEKALKIGASACYIEDLRREFIEELCFPAVQCNAVYENIYLLGESQYNLNKNEGYQK